MSRYLHNGEAGGCDAESKEKAIQRQKQTRVRLSGAKGCLDPEEARKFLPRASGDSLILDF